MSSIAFNGAFLDRKNIGDPSFRKKGDNLVLNLCNKEFLLCSNFNDLIKHKNRPACLLSITNAYALKLYYTHNLTAEFLEDSYNQDTYYIFNSKKGTKIISNADLNIFDLLKTDKTLNYVLFKADLGFDKQLKDDTVCERKYVVYTENN